MNQTQIEHYQAVLADLKTERKELDAHITWIERRIASFIEVPKTATVEPSQGTTHTLPFQHPSGQGANIANTQGVQSARIIDLAAAILKNAGVPLHASVILANLEHLGRSTTIKSITGSMPQDVRKRFENIGGNTWALTEWPESLKEQYRREKGSKPSNDEIQITGALQDQGESVLPLNEV
jgi:hypothetical protein